MAQYENSKFAFSAAVMDCRRDAHSLLELCDFVDSTMETMDLCPEFPMMEWYYLWTEEAGHPYVT